MQRIHQLTLLVAVVALLAVPATAAEIGTADCGGTALQSRDVPTPAPDRIEGVEIAELFPGIEAAGSPAPQSLGGPIGPIGPALCGNVVCPAGTTCCNPLCSACTPPGVSCTLGDCGHGPTS